MNKYCCFSEFGALNRGGYPETHPLNLSGSYTESCVYKSYNIRELATVFCQANVIPVGPYI